MDEKFPLIIPSEDVLKVFPKMKIISENKELFDVIATGMLFNNIPDKNILDPENYFIALGTMVGLFSEIISTMEKNGWKKQ